MIDNEAEAAAQAHKRQGRDDALIRVMARHSITLPSNAIEWRVPPLALTGSFPSLNLLSVRVLCTDGIVGWFLLGDGETLFFGHLSNFVEDKPEQPGRRREGEHPGKAKNSKKKTTVERAENYLAKLMQTLPPTP